MTQLPPVAQFLNLSDDNLILSAFKPSENNPNCWILRCYESQGKPAKLSLESDLNLQVRHPVNILEDSVSEFSQIEPWKIVSFSVNIIK
jgi:alpha-mannosidase